MSVQTASFFIKKNHEPDSRWLREVCEELGRRYALGEKLWVYTPEEEERQILDDLLWTYHDVGFVPHILGVPKDEEAEHYPMVLESYVPEQPGTWTTLVLLHPGLTQTHQAYPHLVVWVASSEVHQGRLDYRTLREEGRLLSVHER